ncbi:MAG: YaiI/YqxD family protein [Sporomusa sp.]
MKILVDADACPKTVLQICKQMGQKYDIPVWTVASFNHNILSDHHIMVGGALQEADIKLINVAEAGDIVITQDWGLAAMVLGRQAYCLSPTGKEYCPDSIDFLLEERELKAKFRRGGGRTKGPSKRTRQDDQHFTATIERILRERCLA